MTDVPAPDPGVFDGGDDPKPETKPRTRSTRPRLQRVRDALEEAGAPKGPSAPEGGALAGDETKPKTTPGERKPRTAAARSAGKREPGAWLYALLYGGVGQVLARSSDELLPVARVLQWNAPVAGRAFDELFAGSLVDRAIVQPLSSRRDKAEAVGNVVGLPLVIYMLTTRPELWPTLEPMARQLFYANLAAMAPVIKERQASEKEMRKVLAELADAGMIERDEAGNVPDADALFQSIFAPPAGVADPEPPAPAPGT